MAQFNVDLDLYSDINLDLDLDLYLDPEVDINLDFYFVKFKFECDIQ